MGLLHRSGRGQPWAAAWGALRALRGFLLLGDKRCDRQDQEGGPRVHLAGQSWATPPKVKTYFTCKENWFCSNSMAEENKPSG